MATASTKSRALTPEENAEFLQQLSQGGELLKAGKVSEAKEHLERAHELQPRNDKGQNLLGLTYFKLGQFDRAAEIYEALVRDNPADPTLRVNLGLVYLKANALQRAVREFETATDLAPEHKKSHNYLGLALAQAGEYARAKEHFILAGSDAMAEKMARALAGEPFQTPAPPSANGAVRAINGSGKHLTGENEDQEQAVEAAPAPDPVQHAESTPEAYAPQDEQSGEWSTQAQGEDTQPTGEALANGHDPYPSDPAAEGEAYATGVDENGQWTNGHDHTYANGADPHPYESYPAPPSDTSEQELPVAGMMEAEEPAPPASAEPMAMDDWGQQADPESAPAEGEPRSEEVPIYDLATDDGILAKEEDDTGIRAGTGIEASFMPDPGASEVDGGTPKPPSADESYAHDPYAETYHALAVAPPPESAYEDPFADAPAEASYAEAHYDRTQMHGQPLVPTAPAYEHGTEHHYAQLSVERPPLDATPVPPSEYLQQALEQSRPPIAEQPFAAPAPDSEPQTQSGEGDIFSHVAGRSRLIDGELRGPFNLKQDSATVVVQGELLTRLTGLLAITGQVEFAPVRKRFRGRVTERDFGAGEEQMMRASGQGVLVLESKGQIFQSSDLNDESAYFREDVVFAFEEPVVYENGNVPSDVAPDVQLVHLRGKGQVLLSLPGPMRSLEVKQGHPVTLPLGHLVGWYGNLSPRVIALVSDGKGKALKAGVELSGEGFALLAVPLR